MGQDGSDPGVTLEEVAGGFITRIRFGKGKRARFLIATKRRADAVKRDRAMRDLATLLATHGHNEHAQRILERAAAAPDQRELEKVVKVAQGLCSGKVRPKSEFSSAMTIRELGEMWTDGKLHKKHPDQVRLKRSVRDDISRLETHVYPVVGDLPISAITLEHCEAVMAGLPKDHSPYTRRNVGQALARLLKMAVYPLRLIERSPIPEGFLPRPSQEKALAYLYPDEDRSLMACTSIPLEYRVL